ncbi:Noc2-domain-containing protein [Coemansia reversa NRRL 1564]|uniref:Noc2-domain-containing protein n=1 Tax=Coemansia reversa (strain ATCC 12441 / NRRL 1564) TaxID=763665 RepID=A0A2G5B9I9_COERN|nr:Noc2-domain-containing protein [Coemansia reversa NRRL 1564]|eukprot:PIA15642.1 Noc2-domain-containing protein [Coemansia reversa NRRL 1564]
MGKVKKATKKYNQKHLKGELERRNKNKKAQQQHKKRELAKRKRGDAEGEGDDTELFTGIEEVDDLANFAGSSIKGVDDDLGRFMQADPENEDRSASDDEYNTSALLGGSDDETEGSDDDADIDDDDVKDESGASDGGSGEEDGGDSDDEETVFKKELKAMKEKDPAFFQFMEKNDPGSLRILEQDSEGEGSDGEDAEMDEDEEEEEDEKAESTGAIEVTTKLLVDWEREIKRDYSLRALKKLLLAFYAASHMDSENGESGDTPYRIQGMRIFNKTVSTAIRAVPKALGHHAPVVGGRVDRKSKKWSVVQALIKSYLASLLELQGQMSDAAMIQYLLKECERMVPYFACFVRYTRELVRGLLRQFGSTAADDGVRIMALLTLRQLVAISPAEIVDMALKGLYLTYVRSSNVKNMASLTTIQLMRNCGVELYGNDAHASYQHAFVYIRQLAIHLRNSMQLRSKESFRAIYNWQFVNSLDFWTEVLATYCGDRAEEKPELCSTLESLVYPLSQIILGVARLVPTAKYFPLRLRCIGLLLRLSSATGVYIPVLPMIIEVLESPEFLGRRPVKSTLKPLALDVHLKAPAEYEHTRVYLEAVLECVFGLLADAIASQSVRIAFPEWTVPVTLQLRRWRKHVGKSWVRFSKQLQGLLDKIDQTSRLVQQHRNNVEFGPSNFGAANRFMNTVDPDNTPVGVYASSLRNVRAQQRATLLKAEMEA